MIAPELKEKVLPYLGDRLAQSRAMLFTGAGFSRDCKNAAGLSLPSGDELKQLLWDLCFDSSHGDASESSLQDVFASAQYRQPTRLTTVLKTRLTVDPNSLPDYYKAYFNAPWSRIYTLNIDDLEEAVATQLGPGRRIKSVSATQGSSQGFAAIIGDVLEVIHLNGMLNDLPEDVTFSRIQYGERAGQQDPWYSSFVSELLSQSVVFVGSKLDESLLWQHIQLRKRKGGREEGEFRPKSYLVTPDLDRAKRDLLQQFNVTWIPSGAEEFARDILGPLAPQIAIGRTKLCIHASSATEIPLVPELAVHPKMNSEFLLGEEPIWADIQTGRAVEREHDGILHAAATRALSESTPGALVLTGTAGSGKSAALMRLALRLSADGFAVGWLDKDTSLSLAEVRSFIRRPGRPKVICIDDADLFGRELSVLIAESAKCLDNPLMIVAIRSGKVDRVIDPTYFSGVPYSESAVPPLSDTDIAQLLRTLTENNRLGALKGVALAEQYRRMRDYAGRQLLIAMLSATSATPFKEKPIKEYEELSDEGRRIYAVICVASAFRFGLQRAEIIMASGSKTNTSLNLLEGLVRRHIVTSRSDGTVRARHRMIAELVFDKVTADGHLRQTLEGLAYVAASQITAGSRSSPASRLMKQILNHDFLIRSMELDQAQFFFASLETLLSWDAHYWLQRGSLEVESGTINLAEHFLLQASGIDPNDLFIRTEWAYLLIRKAICDPAQLDAPRYVKNATETLTEMIDHHSFNGSYAGHILGSQGLAWVRRGIVDRLEQSMYLQELIAQLVKVRTRYPRDVLIEELLNSLKRENLATVVMEPSPPEKIHEHPI